jgi:hypothetical protein
MVSIIPGMEMAAPERTERSNGRAGRVAEALACGRLEGFQCRLDLVPER